MKNINEHFRPLNENIKFEALSNLREIQSNLVSISFLPVLAIMKPTNPLKKSVLKFQDDLDALTISIQEFISEAKEDLDLDGEQPDELIKDEEKEIDVKNKKEEKEESKEKEEKPKDSSNPEL